MTVLDFNRSELADFYAGVVDAGRSIGDYHVTSGDPIAEMRDTPPTRTRRLVTVKNLSTGERRTYGSLNWYAEAVLDVRAGRL